jgi:hypothetical protein
MRQAGCRLCAVELDKPCDVAPHVIEGRKALVGMLQLVACAEVNRLDTKLLHRCDAGE